MFPPPSPFFFPLGAQEAYAREQQIKKREAAERAAAKQREREAREEALKEEKREKRKLRKEKSKVSADATAEEGGGEDERDLHPTSDTPQEIDNLRAQDEVTAETDDLVADEEEQGTKSSGSRKKHKKKPQKKNNTNVAKRKTIKPPVKRNMATFVSQTWKKHPALIAVISFSIVFTILVRARPGRRGYRQLRERLGLTLCSGLFVVVHFDITQVVLLVTSP